MSASTVQQDSLAARVFAEELGHHFDQLLNPGGDTAGDEGDIFSRTLFGESISSVDLGILRQEDDRGVLSLNGIEVAVEFDNSTGTAFNIGTLSGTRSYSGFVGSTDTNDYYRFSVANTSNFSLSLTGLSADAEVALLNANGSTIVSSTNSGSNSESITRQLNTGTYYARVYQYSGNTNYNLSLTANIVAPPDNAGNSTGAARNIGNLSGTQNFSDFVGSADTNDYYRFSVANTSNFSLSLTGLSADAEVQLLDGNGGTIVSSTNSGSNSESITRQLNAGTYYARVYQYSGNTNYNLSLTANPSISPTNWKAEFFNNISRSGSPVAVQDWGSGNNAFSKNWGYDSPVSGISSDNFSVKATTQRYFSPGLHKIEATSDDGVRVTIGNTTVIDHLYNQAATTRTGWFNAGSGGNFNVQIDYYESSGSASLNFNTSSVNQYTTSVGTTNGGIERHVTFDRVQSPGYIEPSKETWLVIHGLDGEAGHFRDLAGAIEEYDGIWSGGNYQVLTVDWSAARVGGLAYLDDAASWIDTVAEAIKNTINSWGISRSNINLVGHSLGAYVAYEVSERLGGINKLVALNPATTTLGGYNHSQVNFRRYTNWSWAFWHNNATDSGDATVTADEAFILDRPGMTVWDGHGAAKLLWTNMLKNKSEFISQWFGLDDIRPRTGSTPWFIGDGWEAKIGVNSSFQPTGNWWDA